MHAAAGFGACPQGRAGLIVAGSGDRASMTSYASMTPYIVIAIGVTMLLIAFAGIPG